MVRAFTLIELIFAIVIIGISVVSLPMMNQAISKGVEKNLVQEAIFAGAAVLNESVSAKWDERSVESPMNPNTFSRVINISGDCNSTTKRMPGHIHKPKGRRCLNDTTITTPSNAASNAVVALEDMEETDENIHLGSVGQAGYKQNYTYTLDVTHPATFGGISNNNIKKIQITIKDETSNIVTKLTTYSANIGETDIYERSY